MRTYDPIDFSALMKERTVLLFGPKGMLCGRIAALLAAHGAAVYFLSHGSSSGCAEMQGAFTLIEYQKQNPDGVMKIVSEIYETKGHIDSLVFCMDPIWNAPLEEISSESIQDFSENNLLALHSLTAAVLPIMKKQAEGTIVGVTSDYAVSAVPGVSVYAAGAAWINAYLRAAAVEESKWGIRCNCVMPGFNIGENGEVYRRLHGDADAQDAFSRFQPLERRGTCQDVANAVLFCASPLSNSITGENFPVDGGTLAVGHSQVWNPKGKPAYTHMYKKEGK